MNPVKSQLPNPDNYKLGSQQIYATNRSPNPKKSMPSSPQNSSGNELQDQDDMSPPSKRKCFSQESKNAELEKVSGEMSCSANLVEHTVEDMPENNLRTTKNNKPKITNVQNVTNYLKTGLNNRKPF